MSQGKYVVKDIMQDFQNQFAYVLGDIQATLIKQVEQPSIVTSDGKPNAEEMVKRYAIQESARKLQVAADYLTAATSFVNLAAGDLELPYKE